MLPRLVTVVLVLTLCLDLPRILAAAFSAVEQSSNSSNFLKFEAEHAHCPFCTIHSWTSVVDVPLKVRVPHEDDTYTALVVEVPRTIRFAVFSSIVQTVTMSLITLVRNSRVNNITSTTSNNESMFSAPLVSYKLSNMIV